MKRNICKHCGEKSQGGHWKIEGLNVSFWLCNFCSKYRIKQIMPFKLQSIIK